MGRYRAAQSRSSAYITAAGHARLKAEFQLLWKTRRPEVVAALSAAAAEGDRSENAEYIYRKKELREIDRRLKFLSQRLEALTVVDAAPSDQSRVFFGAHVRTINETGVETTVWIVGPDESDAATAAISMDSPVARALMKRQVGDVVTVILPGRETELEILEIRYD